MDLRASSCIPSRFQQKLTNIACIFILQRGMSESSGNTCVLRISVELGKYPTLRAGDAPTSKWKNFTQLHFLKDIIKPRVATGNAQSTHTTQLMLIKNRCLIQRNVKQNISKIKQEKVESIKVMNIYHSLKVLLPHLSLCVRIRGEIFLPT